MLRNGGCSLRSAYEILLHISRLTSPLSALINTLRCVRKIAIVIITFIMAVCLSVRTEQFGPHWTDFNEILYFRGFFFDMSRIFNFH